MSYIALDELKKSLKNRDSATVEAAIQEHLAAERGRLEAEIGLKEKKASHFLRPEENFFSADQREYTTILFGGLTPKHERLLEGAIAGLGYKCKSIPTPDVAAFQLGKEYGNNGQCNPTYFTVGNLVQYLQGLEEDGMSRKEIIDNHVFLTAGACGPCRFGMYEAEYRLALRNSGFDGFRVLLFQQSGGLSQSGVEAGLELNMDFFLSILNAMNMGDLVNEIGYLIRPYEVEEGRTDRAVAQSLERVHNVVRDKKIFSLDGLLGRALGRIPKLGGVAEYLGKFLDQLFGLEYVEILEKVGEEFNQIEIDPLRVKPIVKITGEFWAQTTEGDGNFNMFRFLEGESAEVLVEPIATWITYMIHQYKQKLDDSKGIEGGGSFPSWRLDKKIRSNVDFWKRYAIITLAERIFKREYGRLQKALGGLGHQLADQYELQRMGHPFYNSRSGGGEGHLEIAKNIYYSNHDLCHMVLSLKPFGCMPSTQSDGAQAAVVELYKDMIYLPVETSGEGEINAHSRVQMALGNARSKAKGEFQKAVDESGYSLDQIRAYVEAHPELKKPFYKVPHWKGVVGRAANLVLHVGDLIRESGR